MPRRLDVYLRRNLVGQLIQDEHGEMAFTYAATTSHTTTFAVAALVQGRCQRVLEKFGE